MFKHARVTPAGIAVGVIATLVISGTAYAAPQARSLLLGGKNKVTKTTTLTNSKGTPLALNSGKKQPPLKVNSSRKVVRLNADYVDVVTSSAFARTAGRTGIIVAQGGDELAPGASYAVAQAACPRGAQLTGGGGFANFPGDSLFYSGPGSRPNTWEVDSLADGDASTTHQLVAYAVCYNPRGPVKGAKTFAQLRSLRLQLMAGR